MTRSRATITAATAALTLTALTGCSSGPEIAGTTTDAIIATCLTGAKQIGQQQNDMVDGTVTKVTKAHDDGKTMVYITFDATSTITGDDDPAKCEMAIADGAATRFTITSPTNDEGKTSPIKDAVKHWNENSSDDWSDGGGPDTIDAPAPSMNAPGPY